MKIYVLVEGPSEKALLDAWAPRAFPGHEFNLRPHQGKGTLPADGRSDPRRRGLLDQLPATLRAYAKTFGNDEAVLVLVDADAEDCVDLKQRLLNVAKTESPSLNVVFRIAVEETEAFYFGDLKAIAAAFPDADHEAAREFAPDSRPAEGTAETFAKVVRDGTLRKVEWAEKMGTKLTTRPEKSRSPSFKALYAGLERLTTTKAPSAKRRAKHWKSRHSSIRKAGSQK
ncbi:MAG TPA: DUF4276 family protein [Kofleriaceae bacterium]|nr:DUF4276 family protein [Kofleriaceae bacterium]